MGWLNRLFRNATPEFTERVFSSTGEKFIELVDQIRACQDLGVYPVTVVHFRATQQIVVEAFNEHAVSYEIARQCSVDLLEHFRRSVTTLILDSELIPSPVNISKTPKDDRLSPVTIHMAERYPLPERDKTVLSLDRLWPMQMTFKSYTALDEPWLVPFGSKATRQFISEIGAHNTMVLGNPLVPRALRSVQERIAKNVSHEQRCESCKEWMRINLRGKANLNPEYDL